MSEQSALKLTLSSTADTSALAKACASLFEAGERVILEGPLGAGKTFFVREYLRHAGLSADIPVTSPTFALINEYAEISPTVVHSDLYRLGDAGELTELGLLANASEHILLVEWGVRFLETLRPTWILSFEILSAETRQVEIMASSASLRALKRSWDAR